MKNAILNITLFLLLGAVAAQGQALKFAGKTYAFPVVPNTEAWKKLNSHDEMLRVTEIPDSTLRSMSTDDLLATAMNYPLKWDALAYDNIIIGVKRVAAQSSIFKELFRRPEAADKTLAFYQTLDPNTPKAEWTQEESGMYSLTLSFVESLLAHPQVITKLGQDQSIVLLQRLNENHIKMQSRADLYGGMSQAIPAFVAGKILSQQGVNSDQMKQVEVSGFLQGRFTLPSEIAISTIFSATEHFLTTNKK